MFDPKRVQADAVTHPYIHLNQEHCGNCRVMMVSAGKRGRRCEVSVTEPIKIRSSRTSDPNTSPLPYNQPPTPSWRRGASGETLTGHISVCVRILYVWICMDFYLFSDLLVWGLSPIQEILHLFSQRRMLCFKSKCLSLNFRSTVEHFYPF